MADNESNVFGMPTDTINTLQDNLHDRYDSGFPVLKELIQNANDAKASVLKVFKFEGISNTTNPLLQKKAILVFNDGEVKSDDLDGIKRVARGGKIGKPGLIGKFGLGMKSIFHFSDMFFLCAFIKGKTTIQLVNPFIDIVEKKDPYHPDWASFPESDEEKMLNQISEYVGNPEKGLLLWIPLRDDSYKAKISKAIYTLDTIWNQDSESLKKNIALALASLEISTPCINTSRTLEVVEILNQTPVVKLEYKKGSKEIKSDGKIYCEVINSDPIADEKGNELLSKIIQKDKFDKMIYTDENWEQHEWSSYTENQKVGLSIVRFTNLNTSKICINWCSYLPLNGTDDTEFYDSRLNNEYHIIAHANFSIDSGRRNIDGYNDWCINKESLVDENFDSVIDNASSQKEWNKILIRYFILPNILKFAAEKGEGVFFDALYTSLSGFGNKLGYFCFDKGIVFKNRNKLEYQKTESISESGLYLVKRTTERYSDVNCFADTDCFKTTVGICNYIQSEQPDINWSISVAEKTLDYNDLAQINKIITDKNYPILLLPSFMEKIYLDNTYRLSDAELVINFLEEFETVLEDKASDIFESLCNNDSITKDVSREIFTNERIKRYVKLFKVTSLDPEETKFNAEGKTFNEICTLSNNSQLFFYVAQNDSKQERELQPIYLLQRMCPNITFYCAGRATAKNQLFLKEDEKNSIYKYITEIDLDNPTDEPQIKLLDSIKITSILYAMKQNLDSLEFGDVPVADEFISRTKYLTEEEKEEYFDVLRSILLGKVTKDTLKIYKLVSSLGHEARADLFYGIINKYSITEYNEHIIRAGFDYPQSLIGVLGIKEISDEDLERKLPDIASNIKNATSEEKELLSKFIYDEEVFQKLEIHKTVSGEFVNLESTAYKCYLESEDENIRFPVNYNFPDNFKLIRRNEDIPLQSCIEELSYKVLINTILLDKNNGLGSNENVKLSGFVCSLLEKTKGKLKQEDIYPNSRKRKWIPDYSHNFYSLDEVIDCLGINESLIELSPGLIHASKIDENYYVCRDYFVKEKNEGLRQLLSHSDSVSDNKWPWFNFQSFPVLKSDDVAKELLPYILKAEDSSIKIINEVLKGNEEEIIDALRNLQQESFIKEPTYISQKYEQFIIMLGKDFNAGDSISDDMLSLIEGIFKNINEDEILDVIELAKKEKEVHLLKLPSEGKTWNAVCDLANFKISIPDLKAENTLSRRISQKFPSIQRRVGSDNNGTQINTEELIEKLESCKNPKLWGAFCHLIFDDNGKLKLANRGRLIEKNTIDTLKNLRLPKVMQSKVLVYRTEDNYCESLTSDLIKLKDAKEMDTVFYNNPEFNFDNGEMKVEMFDNFSAFSETSIENAIRQLFSILTSNLPSESFFKDLANPSQTPLKTAINMIFTNVFATLKVLKLDTRAGQYNQIADQYKLYMEACGNEDYATMKSCCNAIQGYIEADSGQIQKQIRERVINYIREAEYQERCILFELFQNGDDAYVQKGSDSRISYFNITSTKDSMKVEHSGRPINEYKSGGFPEYKSDLANMLTIGWSDKANMNGRQTGKFGYGFKTVYLVSDEPHVKSGDYDFVVKAALYPKQAGEGYTEKTIITLPLNENGIKKRTDVISEFEKAAKFLVVFAKRIRQIRTDDNIYEWIPKKSAELSQFTVESDGELLLFRTIPRNIQDPQCQFVSFAFKVNGDVVIPLDEKTPKMWCLAPLSDFNGLNFAVNADFKTNTGRQTLACENPDNKKMVDKISTMLIDALFEMKDNSEFGSYFDSIINILLDSKTKSKGFLTNFSEYAVQKCLNNKLLPNGTSKVFNYTEQNIYALSAHPFGSHVAVQHKYINAMNDFINDCGESDYVVTTQILADLMPEKHESPIVEMKNIITILDCLLNKNANNVGRQKEILLKFKDSPLFDYVREEKEELTNCKIKSSDGSVKMIKRVVEVSPEYGEAATILSGLYTPDKEVVKQHYQNQNQDNQKPEEDDYVPPVIYPIEEVYNWWSDQYQNGRWPTFIERYYEEMRYPSIMNFDKLKANLKLSDEDYIAYKKGDKKGCIPEDWCILLWVAAAQSMPSNWGNRNESNRRGIETLRTWGVFKMFCEGENLQSIYEEYLKNTKNDETRVHLFELLLRLHKYRMDFCKFYDLIENLPRSGMKKLEQFLVLASDEELSGWGVNIAPGNRTFKLGIRTIIQNLGLCGFWEDSTPAEMKNIFDIFRGEDAVSPELDGTPELVKQFYSSFDLPFQVYNGVNGGNY